MSSFPDFLMPRRPYHGKVNPENLVFDANLQEFAYRVSYISNLELIRIEWKNQPSGVLQAN